MGKQVNPVKRGAFLAILPEIRSLIEMSRHHVAVAANLGLVNLYWNVGQVITRDIQKNEKRAEYGEQLVEELGHVLSRDYGQGFSSRNLWDMKRFYMEFRILQALPAEFDSQQVSPAAHDKSRTGRILQALPAEFKPPITIDFRKHSHLG